jgi:hypothetical protein
MAPPASVQWDLDSPEDTSLANTIHTIIQTAKVAIMERLRVTNGDSVDEHDFYGSTATGAHAISQVGFANIVSSLVDLDTFKTTYSPQSGTLHYVSGTEALYVNRNGAFIPMITLDHGELTGLTDLADHPQYLATNGSRSMAADLDIKSDGTLSITSFGTDNDSPLNASHTTTAWHSAHGDDSIATTAYADESVYSMNVTTSVAGYSLTFGLWTIRGYTIPDYSFLPHTTATPAVSHAPGLFYAGTHITIYSNSSLYNAGTNLAVNYLKSTTG